MKQKLLDYLVCPECRSKLELSVAHKEQEEIVEGVLTCSGCQSRYHIFGGVPRMLSGVLAADKKATAEAFGYEWTHFTELTDKYEAQFLDWVLPVEKSFFAGKIILDAGCGKGRHVDLSARFGARDVIGIDLSEAVDTAFANLRRLPNAHIVQADIYHLPFVAPFDYIYSIGVLHHLPDPKKGFLALLKHLRPGGRISAWVYGREGNWWIEHILNPVRINFTSRLPKIFTKGLAFILAAVMQAALKLIYRPVNLFLPTLKRFLFYNDYLFSISGFSFQENYSIVFDHLVAPTAFYIAKPEFATWFTDGQLKDAQISWRNRNSWRGTGVKQNLNYDL
jgi:SAM-dependent methyltransferase